MGGNSPVSGIQNATGSILMLVRESGDVFLHSLTPRLDIVVVDAPGEELVGVGIGEEVCR